MTLVMNRYRLGEEIGRGATGRVFKAEDLQTGTQVAVKRIPLGTPGGPRSSGSSLQDVMGELELLKTLNHVNVVQYLGSCQTSNHLYIMLEYMEKGSLASIIKQGVSLNEELASVYIAQVLQGLRYLHKQGVVHRDIKGANILTNAQGVVKLADFGVSAKLGELDANSEIHQHVAGTPYWMAPEVIEMEQGITSASDIWSVGCLVVEALTGSPPYFDLQPMSALFRIVADEHPPLPPNISPLMQNFLMQCFQKDPASRPGASELLQHEWITERRQTLHRTWRGFMPARTRASISNALAFESLSVVVNQDLGDSWQQAQQQGNGSTRGAAAAAAAAGGSPPPSGKSSPSGQSRFQPGDTLPGGWAVSPFIKSGPSGAWETGGGVEENLSTSSTTTPHLSSENALGLGGQVVRLLGSMGRAGGHGRSELDEGSEFASAMSSSSNLLQPSASVEAPAETPVERAASQPMLERPAGLASPSHLASSGSTSMPASGAHALSGEQAESQPLLSAVGPLGHVGIGDSGVGTFDHTPTLQPRPSQTSSLSKTLSSPRSRAKQHMDEAAAGVGGGAAGRSGGDASTSAQGDGGLSRSSEPDLTKSGSFSHLQQQQQQQQHQERVQQPRHSPRGHHRPSRSLIPDGASIASTSTSVSASGVPNRHHDFRQHPNAPTYDRWFRVADRDGDGRISGPEAAPFLQRSGLNRDVLFAVWQSADLKKQGFLDRGTFFKAMDAISLAQRGCEFSRDNLIHVRREGGPLPKLRGFDTNGEPDGTDDTVAAAATPAAAADASACTAGGSRRREAPVATRGGVASTSYSTAAAAPTSAWGKVLGKSGAAAAALQGRGSGGASAAAAAPRQGPAKPYASVLDGLKAIYFEKILPLEKLFSFSHFTSAPFDQSYFDAKPAVLLLGQYSTGKTSFINYLLGRDYPGAHVGPEPTTDRFVVIHQGVEDRRTAGDKVAARKDLPYQGMTGLGAGFLSRLEGAQCSAPFLDDLSFVDTPGILSGDKQRADRGYDFLQACRWLAFNSDLVLLFFDPEKLDISDELAKVIKTIGKHGEKLCVVLNKASHARPAQMMRMLGALMWGLGRLCQFPERVRVFIGSFSGEPGKSMNPMFKSVMEPDERELLDLLQDCPKTTCDRKINELLKRVRALKVHLLLVDHLRKQLHAALAAPQQLVAGALAGGADASKRRVARLLADMHKHFWQVQRAHRLPPADFPDPQRYREILSGFDLLAFPKVLPAMMKKLDDVLNEEIPSLTKLFESSWAQAAER